MRGLEDNGETDMNKSIGAMIATILLMGCGTPTLDETGTPEVNTRVSITRSSTIERGASVDIEMKIDTGCLHATYPKFEEVSQGIQQELSRKGFSPRPTSAGNRYEIRITFWNCAPMDTAEAALVTESGYGTHRGVVQFGTYNPIIDIPLYLIKRTELGTSNNTKLPTLVTDVEINGKEDNSLLRMRIVSQLHGSSNSEERKRMFGSQVSKKIAELF